MKTEDNIVPPTLYKAEVIADNSETWAGNALTFCTVEEAETYARNLSMRWTAVRRWRVVNIITDKVESSGS